MENPIPMTEAEALANRRARFEKATPKLLAWARDARREPEKRFSIVNELCEVIEVRIIGENKPNHIYGTIIVNDGFDLYCIYLREKSEMEAVDKEGMLTLIGPKFGISGSETVYFELDLKDSYGHQLIRGQAGSDFTRETPYGKYITEKVAGEGQVSALIAFFGLKKEVEASVQVRLLSKKRRKDCDAAHVYGELTAWNTSTSPSMPEKKIWLFKRKSEKDFVRVEPSKDVDLDRNVKILPLHSSLVIEANLKDACGFVIANGLIEIPAMKSGESVGEIDGSNGKIQVRVTWLSGHR